MKTFNKIKVLFFLVFYYSNSMAFDKEVPVYGIIKPASMTTLLAVNHGIVLKISRQIGDSVSVGSDVVHILEKETTRIFRTAINGQVAKLHVTNGAAVTPGMPLVTIIDPDKKDIEVSLSSTEAKEIKAGQHVSLAADDSDFGEISKISPLVDPDTGAVVAYVQPKSKVKNLIGDVVSLRINLGKISSCKEIPLTQLKSITKKSRIVASSKDKVCVENLEKIDTEK